MRVAVCDDERLFREYMKNAIYTYSKLNRLEITIEEFLSGEDLLRSKYDFEIIFLDYKMEGIDGLETARVLRDKNISSTIIFLTGYPKFIYEAFEVSPFRFFRKPLEIEQLYKALDDYFKSLEDNRPILLRINGSTVCIQTYDILYLEADNKRCYVNLPEERLHVAKTMASVENLLPKNVFHKVHRAFIVNFIYINNYDKENVYLKKGMQVPVSRKYHTSFREAYRNYAKGRSI